MVFQDFFCGFRDFLGGLGSFVFFFLRGFRLFFFLSCFLGDSGVIHRVGLFTVFFPSFLGSSSWVLGIRAWGSGRFSFEDVQGRASEGEKQSGDFEPRCMSCTWASYVIILPHLSFTDRV